jgi:type I restriction enzyme R subunit
LLAVSWELCHLAAVLTRKAAADMAYQNAKHNSDKQNAGIEHDKALGRVIVDLMKDDTELFKAIRR